MKDMELEKIKQHIICSARNKKKWLGDNMPTVSIKMSIWCKAAGNGRKEHNVFKIEGREFEADDTTLYGVRQISQVFATAVKELNATRGYLAYELHDKYMYEDRDVFGRFTNSEEIVSGVILCSKPCKEFEALRRVVRKYANVEIKDLDLYSVEIVGKRGMNYIESGKRHYYAYDSKKCLGILEWIRKYKASSDKLIVGIEEKRDCEDEDYSRRYETESYGTKHRLLTLRIITKGGNEKAINDSMYM